MEKPLAFEDWKGNKAASFNDELLKSMDRLHSIDYKKEFEEMLKVEYQNYVDDFNGNWLLK
ncbi:hypothetical protein UFOVP240_65 [uncultured Caudovirales phage]|jgi:hypothetical protein|uniref:Uncharacterized protein n=1 Tax=uncultured Caudovirales phage TaxID=2100421 RepID=A0A6J7WSN7_9CAUD|nr:hypothetical protein UFOVP240_65 [uncultured Caudovirales phage]